METKICKCCGKELSVEKFGVLKSHKDGFNPMCKECHNKKCKEYRVTNRDIVAKGKKKYYELYKEQISIKRKQDYVKNKLYVNKQTKQYYKANKEIINMQAKQYYIENKETFIKRSKIYYMKNKEHFCEVSRRYSKDNKESVKEQKKQYCKLHPTFRRMMWQRREAKKRLLPNTLTIKQWENIKASFDNKCAYCGKEKPLAQEHFLALSSGGEYTVNNIIPSCKSCNSSKCNKDFFQWYPKHKYYSVKREKFILKFLNYKDGLQQLKII